MSSSSPPVHADSFSGVVVVGAGTDVEGTVDGVVLSVGAVRFGVVEEDSGQSCNKDSDARCCGEPDSGPTALRRWSMMLLGAVFDVGPRVRVGSVGHCACQQIADLPGVLIAHDDSAPRRRVRARASWRRTVPSATPSASATSDTDKSCQ